MLAKNEVLQQGRYRIINQFGQDGRGTVYEAFDNVLEKNVLLRENPASSKKVITVSQMETRNAAFADEAKFLTNIKHESLLHVRDYFAEIDRQYLVLEYADGKNVSELLNGEETAFLLQDVTNWADQLLDALSYLHAQAPPIIHHDINPQNLRLTSDGKIKLLAVGINKNPDTKLNSNATNQASAKTLHYLPLEQIWGGLDAATQRVITNSYDEKSVRFLERPADARSDIYALGATLYHLLTAQFPVDALERSIEILEGKPDPLPVPHKLNPAIPPEVSDVLIKAMEIKRENRFFSAVIMRQVLRTAFVRVKEREAQEPEKKEESFETPPKVKNADAERRIAELKHLAVKVEQQRQAQLLKEQLLEAKARKSKIEETIIAVEEKHTEPENKESVEEEITAVEVIKPAEIFSPAPPLAETVTEPAHVPIQEIIPAPVKENTAFKSSSEEFSNMFAAPQKDNKVWRQMSVIAVVLILIGGIGGFWLWQQSGKTELNEAVIAPSVSTTEKTAGTEPATENAPALKAETTPETSNTPPVLTQNPTEKTVSQPLSKNKIAAPRVQKPVAPPTKTTPKQPKTITVEDLINGN